MNQRNTFRTFVRGLLFFGAGLAVGYLTAPKTGRGTRSWLNQQGQHAMAQARDVGNFFRRRVNYEEGRLTGVSHRIRKLVAVGEQEDKYVDDDLITQRVRTRIGENKLTHGIPRINVDTANRIVTLRGAVSSPADCENLEKVAAAVEDVDGVVNKTIVMSGKAAEA